MSTRSDRTIRLRRPPALSVIDGPFVPHVAAARLDEVDRRWETLLVSNPAYYDGRLYHVLGVHRNGCGGAVVHAAECAYRYHAVQDESFDVGVRPLGVKGITRRDGLVLLGRRSMHVASYKGRWELAPGGVVEPGDPPSAQPSATAIQELREETGWTARREPRAIALLYDDEIRCWEVVFEIEAAEPGEATTNEYDEVAWVDPARLPADLTPVARRMAALI